MGKETKVICDQCKMDLTTTGNAEDWRLVLASEAKTPWYVAEGLRGGAVTAMAKLPPVERAYYFCALPCLNAWLSPRQEQLMGSYLRHVKHTKWLEEQQQERANDQQSQGFGEIKWTGEFPV